MEDSKNNLFPVFFKLEDLRLLIVGGGNVAAEKLSAVWNNSPMTWVRMVAKDFNPETEKLISEFTTIERIQRQFQDDDLDSIDLVILAVNDIELAATIKAAARKRNLLVNVADTPDLCDFYLGSIVQKGNLKIAISTNGKSPTVAKRLREVLQDAMPEQLDDLLDNLQAIRNRLKGSFRDKVQKLNELTKSLIE